jgi:hypothetical protein
MPAAVPAANATKNQKPARGRRWFATYTAAKTVKTTRAVTQDFVSNSAWQFGQIMTLDDFQQSNVSP